MKEKLSLIVAELKKELASVSSLNDTNQIKVKYLGKNGELTAILKNMKNVAPEDRPMVGKLVNDAREEITTLIDEKESVLKVNAKNEKLLNDKVDVTIPVDSNYIGSEHPLNIVKNQIIDIFTGLGFSIEQGLEVETDWYCFQALNIPKDHPARDMQDTFYIDENVVLRTHTSPAQIRTMEKQKPPIRILCPGRVYRADDDATHSPVFHQIEGLVIDENITLCDLKGTLDYFAKKMFSEDTKVRLRPSHFPFTEPSVEVDLSCMMCGGKGCKLCKGTGWIEILGAGMVNHKVLENCGLDPEKYNGFAFGFGIERIAMIKYGIPDIRLFYENDLRLLKRIR